MDVVSDEEVADNFSSSKDFSQPSPVSWIGHSEIDELQGSIESVVKSLLITLGFCPDRPPDLATNVAELLNQSHSLPAAGG
jgi:hypothetical protein